MLRNLVRISLRLINRNRTHSLINFLGLSLGLFVFTLIYLYVNYELSYDRYHQKYDRIFRVIKEADEEHMGSNKYALSQAPLANVLREDVPEVESVARLLNYGTILVKTGNESFVEKKFNAVDAEAFDVFSFEWIAGSKREILKNPTGVVLNETLANKYFGSAGNAIGKTITVEWFKPLGDFIVEGVIKDMPGNSHFRMDIIFQFEAMVNLIQPTDLANWKNTNYYTYLTLQENADVTATERKINEAIKKHFESKSAVLKLQPLGDIHIGQGINFDLTTPVSMNRLYIFSSIGILVLIIACINYMNMATAQASKRAKEIGLRKVTGARKRELIVQFIGEAVFITALSMIIAYFAVLLILPQFNTFLEKNITLNIQSQPILIGIFAGLTLLVGMIAGAYPAVILSSLNPTVALKGMSKGGTNFYLRDTLVVVQFIISGALIFVTLIIWNQMHFIDTKDLGYNRKQVVIIPLQDRTLMGKTDAIKNKLLQNPDILNVASSSRPPLQMTSSQGRTWSIKGEVRNLVTFYCEIDPSFIDVYEIKILAGKNLSVNGHKNDVIVNEALVKELGYTNDEIVGVTFSHGDSSHVVGVMQDFHFQDLKQKVQPLRLKNYMWDGPYLLSLKVNEHTMQATLKYVEEVVQSFSDKYPFEYRFYDDMYDRVYASEIKTAKLMGWFAGVAIVIATLGLYGLVLFVVNQRVREIGIRKVLGASVPSVMRLLSMRFIVLILIGYGAACAIGYYSIQQWLNSFAYKVSPGIGIFLVTFMAMIFITGVAIFFRVRQAAAVNPATILKYE